MDQKEFCLKWNSYSDVFQGTFAALLRNEHFTDVTLSCDGQTIKCHKVVLSACSAYFETLLLDTSHPHPIIILRDVKFRDMQALVKFMYTGEVTVAQAQINSLIKVADLLKIKGLADPDESSQTVQSNIQPPERTVSTPPPSKRKRVETDSENNIYKDPLQDIVPSMNKGMNNSLPIVGAPETSSSSNPQPEETGASPLHLKEEIGEVSLEGGDDSSSQYEDQGDDFDYGNDNLIGTETGEKMEAGPSTSLNPSDIVSCISRGPRRNPIRSYTEENLERAILMIKSGRSVRGAAMENGIPVMSLYCKAKALGVIKPSAVSVRRRGKPYLV